MGRTRVGKQNAWFLSSEDHVASTDVRDHLNWLLRTLLPNSRALRELQRHAGIKMYVFCPWWSKRGGGGPSLWSEQMKGLADLDLEFTVGFADYSDHAVDGSQTE